MKNMKFAKRVLLFTVLTLMLSRSYEVEANGVEQAGAIDFTRAASMEIELSVEDEETVIVIPEMPIRIYRVASLSQENNTILYHAIAPFDSAAVDYTRLVDAATSAQAARRLSERTSGAQGILAVTNEAGIARIENAEMGMYLVVAVEETNGYSFDPFLLSIPFLQESAREEPIWIYEVRTKPKAASRTVEVEVPKIPGKTPEPEPLPEPTPPSKKGGKPVNTGDEANFQFWRAMVGVSVLGISCVVAIKKKNTKAS